MPKQEKKTDLGRYDSMDTQALQELLRADASKSEAEVSDQETILYIMEVLAKRRKDQNQGKSLDEAWEIFQRSYNECTGHISERKPAKVCNRWKKSLVAAAAVVVLLLGSTVTAQGFGVDLWQTIAKWTQETLFLGYMGQTEESMGAHSDYMNPCASLQTALDEFKAEKKLVPTWIPEGYAETDVTVTQTPTQRIFTAVYLSGDQTIRIHIANYISSHPSEIEQSASLLEIYEAAGVQYYIFSNHDQLKAVWIDESYEGYIVGPVSCSEMKKMIDSIEKG